MLSHNYNRRSRTTQSDSIHYKIQTVCNYLSTRFVTKKHGGFTIYEDDKIIASTDTFVPNVDLSVKVNGNNEHVFGCSYDGSQVTYHPGKWEDYLQDLYLKAEAVQQQRLSEEQRKLEQDRVECERAASDAANNVFC